MIVLRTSFQSGPSEPLSYNPLKPELVNTLFKVSSSMYTVALFSFVFLSKATHFSFPVSSIGSCIIAVLVSSVLVSIITFAVLLVDSIISPSEL